MYKADDNRGYLNGCIYGVDKLLETSCIHINDFEWVAISNTDISLKKNFFGTLAAYKCGADIWCIAPDIVKRPVNESKSKGVHVRHLNPFIEKRPDVKSMGMKAFIFGKPFLFVLYVKLSGIKGKLRRKSAAELVNVETTEEEKEIYSAQGSLFIIRKECYLRLKEYAGNIFLYGEEILVSEVCRIMHKREMYVPMLRAVHSGEMVLGKEKLLMKQKWMGESVRYLYKIFFKIEVS